MVPNPINMNDLGESLCLETPIYTQQTTKGHQTFQVPKMEVLTYISSM